MQNICVVNVILMTLKQYFNENHISIFKYSYIFGYCVISKFYTKKNLSMNGFIYKPLCTKLRLTVAKKPCPFYFYTVIWVMGLLHVEI